MLLFLRSLLQGVSPQKTPALFMVYWRDRQLKRHHRCRTPSGRTIMGNEPTIHTCCGMLEPVPASWKVNNLIGDEDMWHRPCSYVSRLRNQIHRPHVKIGGAVSWAKGAREAFFFHTSRWSLNEARLKRSSKTPVAPTSRRIPFLVFLKLLT